MLAVVVAVVAIAAGTLSFLSALDEAYERQDDVLYQVADLVARIQTSALQSTSEMELQDSDHDSSLRTQISNGTTTAPPGQQAAPLPSRCPWPTACTRWTRRAPRT